VPGNHEYPRTSPPAVLWRFIFEDVDSDKIQMATAETGLMAAKGNGEGVKTCPKRPLRQAELDSLLEKAAGLLRAGADHSEFRGYVFALLFYKRINDVYLENVAALEKELGDAELALDLRMHDFVVPDDSLWAKVARKTERELSGALNDAMLAIERAKAPKFDGILANSAVDFNAQDRLPRSKLVAIISHFGSLPLGRARVHDDLFVVRETNNDRLLVSGKIEDESLCRDALTRWLMRKTREFLVPRLEQLSARTGMQYKRTFLKRPKTRWASCSRNQSISVNAKLMFLPPEYVDYVLIHELCHIAKMNHSKRFWALVEHHNPNFRKLDNHLREMWKTVPRWAYRSE
jgi:Protein of unknown function DUF45/HsdM N-terminal domain